MVQAHTEVVITFLPMRLRTAWMNVLASVAATFSIATPWARRSGPRRIRPGLPTLPPTVMAAEEVGGAAPTENPASTTVDAAIASATHLIIARVASPSVANPFRVPRADLRQDPGKLRSADDA